MPNTAQDTYECTPRTLQDIELVQQLDITAEVLNGAMQHFALRQADRDPSMHRFYGLHDLLGKAIVVTEDAKVDLNEDLFARDSLVLFSGIVQKARGCIDCQGCSLQEGCTIDDVTKGALDAALERMQKADAVEKFFRAPLWMRSSWVLCYKNNGSVKNTDEKKISKKDEEALLSDKPRALGLSAKEIGEIIDLPNLVLSESAKKIKASKVSSLDNLPEQSVRKNVDVPVIELETTYEQDVRIIDAQGAFTGNNAQNPNMDDVAVLLGKLIKLSSEAIDRKPALLVPRIKGYKAISGYGGTGILVEFKMRKGKGGKSRLYGIVDTAEDGLVEFTILGASSGNGNKAQNTFFTALGLN